MSISHDDNEYYYKNISVLRIISCEELGGKYEYKKRSYISPGYCLNIQMVICKLMMLLKNLLENKVTF